jgi:predicted RNA-binding protein YlxR (DUF448 family)
VGCRGGAAPSEMVRLVLGSNGDVLPDLAGKAFGRGAWIHPIPDCVAKGVPRGVARSWRTSVRSNAAELTLAVRAAASRRIDGLLRSAGRSRQLAVGSLAVRGALERGQAELVVVAVDAQASADSPWVRQAVSAGQAVAWGTKEALGDAVGRGEAGVVAVLHARLAREVRRSIALAHLGPPGPERKAPSNHPCTEDR